MLLSLTGTCVIAGAILAGVNEVTKEPIAQTKAATLEAAIKAVTPAFDNKPTEESYMVATPEGDSLRIYPAKNGGEMVGAAVESFTKKGFGGEIKVIVGFDMDGKSSTTLCFLIQRLPVWEQRCKSGFRQKRATKVSSVVRLMAKV